MESKIKYNLLTGRARRRRQRSTELITTTTEGAQDLQSLRLSRKERRLAQKETEKQIQNKLILKEIKPLTANQQKTFRSFRESEQHLFLHGSAGTGKSFIALYLTIHEIVHGYSTRDKVIVARSVVPSRDMGFLPGNAKEKTKEYEAPYQDICENLFGRGDAYSILKSKGQIEFISTSFLRGRTLNNCYLIVDEIQNMTAQEANTIITRVGDNCRIIFAGDIKQSDLDNRREYSGLSDFNKIITRMRCFDFIEFNRNDIVRSALVKEYLTVRETLEESGTIQPLGK